MELGGVTVHIVARVKEQNQAKYETAWVNGSLAGYAAIRHGTGAVSALKVRKSFNSPFLGLVCGYLL